MDKYILIAIVSGIISAFAQILLKKSSLVNHCNRIKEYLNPYVISSYGLTFMCIIMMVMAYRGLPFKYGMVLEALVYFYVMIMSRVLLHEELTTKRVFGNLIIVCGVVVFSL